MDNIKRQQDFFEVIKNILNKYPDLAYDDLMNVIYSALIKVGVPVEERSKSLSPMFSTWVHNFKNMDNIKAFYDPRWKSFCQFENKNIKVDTAIKIYVPMDSAHIYKGANDLFTFLANEDIPHLSKIRDKVTFDNVVIRVNNLEDAEKITDYINKNSYIKEGLIPANPFLIEHDGIAHAIDGGTTSYNSVLSEAIANYIANKMRYKETEDISLSDFQQYLIKRDEYNKTNDNNPNHEKNNVIKLALKIVNTNSDYTEFKKDAKIREEQSLKGVNCESILKEAVSVIVEKYGVDVAVRHLKSYVETGNTTAFSRTNNSREKVKLYLNKDSVKTIINEMLPGEDQEKRFVELAMDKDIDEEKMHILEQASMLTYSKYKESTPGQLKAALQHLVFDKDYSYFTNLGNGREKLKLNVVPDEVLSLMKNQLITDNIIDKNQELDNPFNLYVMNVERKVKANSNSQGQK